MDDPEVAVFMDRYGFTSTEAIQWVRLVGMGWNQLESEFILNGPSEELRIQVETLLSKTDQKLFYENFFGLDPYSNFREFVDGVIQLSQ